MKPVIVCWVCCGLALAAGCAKAPKQDCAPASAPASAPTPGRPVDSTLVAFLSRARAAHHLADAAERQGSLQQALIPLAAVVQGPLPSSGQLAPETREVLADTWGRLAHLHSQLGAFDEADRAVARGLQHAPQASYFEGYLIETRGLNEERRAKALEARGETAQANLAKQRALSDLEHAMRIQGAVIEQQHKAPNVP